MTELLQPIELIREIEIVPLATLVLVGLAGGLAGGLVGIGGSLVMIPALTMLFGRDQHLYQAAAMIVNAAVAGTATVRHARAGAIRGEILRWMLPPAVLLVAVGVLLSNRFDQRLMQAAFGAFMLYVAISEGRSLLRKAPPIEEGPGEPRRGAVLATGGVTGFVAGLLGIGGGGIAVPMLRSLCRVPLRQAIATTSAVMLASAAIGAALKNLAFAGSLGGGRGVLDSLALAAILIPAGMAGAWIGASLTHRLPLRAIRIAFAAIMAAGGARMLLG